MKKEINPGWWTEIDPQFDFERAGELKETKQLLQETDNLQIPEEDEFYANLHDKIMAAVDSTTIAPVRGSIWQKKGRLNKRTVAAVVAAIFLFAGRQTSHQAGEENLNGSLSDAVSRTANIESTVLVYQHKDDFLVDLAKENLDHLTVSQLKKLIKTEMLN
jgi:hypothetical protein